MPRTNLTDALRSLYDELHEAMSTIPVRDGLNFRYDSVEVELAMEMGESTEGGGGAKFWVVETSGKKAAEQRTTHTMRINLTPGGRTNQPFEAAVSMRRGILPVAGRRRVGVLSSSPNC